MLHDNTGKLSKQDQTKSVVFHFIGLRHKFTPRFVFFILYVEAKYLETLLSKLLFLVSSEILAV